ncbi:ABC-type transport systems, involved in lipoprotein release, permease components [Microscilla marina ATCC 23134]|uniref:ABC-type transport systems, involved in lipoprotein release, permease components n=1 Tax=Microscilla marina ATCC 23134 TaxID=313606 RepID=A1ZV51_MICM2|nr:ABC-type transport systems, involved in lipoprotein release, permease components [Microscilla marina ATCC 23134]
MVAWDAILANKLRATLTALGIIFGVSAVIAMLAIGNGAQQEILEQIKLVGVNNIVIKPVLEQEEKEVGQNLNNGGKKKEKFSPGLTMRDVESIRQLPMVSKVSPEILLETYIIKNGIQRSAKLVGVEPAYFKLTSFKLEEGQMFTQQNLEYGDQVCIIGRGIKTKFFSKENPIGKRLKCGRHWLKVIGVLEPRLVSSGSLSKLGIRDYNMDIYTPTKTMLVRYTNRSVLTKAMLTKANNRRNNNNNNNNQSNEKAAPKNYHQIDRLVVQVDETGYLSKTADIVARMLERRHYKVVDYEVSIPELLLKQQQRTKDIFNIVLGVIAGISLLVGGIGIMNIMLASVLERIKEIGLRLSIGAKKSDIITQFMFESVLISVSGGIIGVILGVSMSYFIAELANIPTIVSFSSIIISFVVSASVGLIFGITPARRAAEQDPITSLRYE